MKKKKNPRLHSEPLLHVMEIFLFLLRAKGLYQSFSRGIQVIWRRRHFQLIVVYMSRIYRMEDLLGKKEKIRELVNPSESYGLFGEGGCV